MKTVTRVTVLLVGFVVALVPLGLALLGPASPRQVMPVEGVRSVHLGSTRAGPSVGEETAAPASSADPMRSVRIELGDDDHDRSTHEPATEAHDAEDRPGSSHTEPAEHSDDRSDHSGGEDHAPGDDRRGEDD